MNKNLMQIIIPWLISSYQGDILTLFAFKLPKFITACRIGKAFVNGYKLL